MFHFADSSSATTPPNVTSPPPSNIALSNDQNSSLATCQREKSGIFILASVCGGLIACVVLSYVACLVRIIRQSKRRTCRGRRVAGIVRGVEALQQTRDVLQLCSNSILRASPLLEGSVKISDHQQPPFEITPNPSYSVISVIKRPVPSEDSTHQYDDIINYPRKEEGPCEEYDRLNPSEIHSVGQNSQGRKGDKDEQHGLRKWGAKSTPCRSNTLLPTSPCLRPALQGKPPPKSPPKPPPRKVCHTPPPPWVQTATPPSAVQSVSPERSAFRGDYRLSAVSEDYVNELDGPASVYTTTFSKLSPSPGLQSHPSPSTLKLRKENPANYDSALPQDYETSL